MFLNLGNQLAKGETCGDARRRNARYMNANKTEVDHQLISPMMFRLISLYMGSPLSCLVLSCVEFLPVLAHLQSAGVPNGILY